MAKQASPMTNFAPATIASSREDEERRSKPDLVIKVGDQSFHHFSQILCFASGFFDVALHSGMQESRTLSFDFPDKDPKEWNLFVSFLEPCTTAKITKDNVKILIPWFHHFQVPTLLEACAEVYYENLLEALLEERKRERNPTKRLDIVLGAAPFCSIYGLSKATALIVETLTIDFLKNSPSALLNNPLHVQEVLDLLLFEDFRDPLWSSLLPYLPSSIEYSKDLRSLLQNALLPMLVKAGIENVVQDQELKKEMEKFKKESEEKRDLKKTLNIVTAERNKAKCKVDLLVQTANDLPRKLRDALPKRNTVPSKGCLSAFASDRLQHIISSDSRWSPPTRTATRLENGRVITRLVAGQRRSSCIGDCFVYRGEVET
jgi:hypothetical protein